jgi:hypothetical protein
MIDHPQAFGNPRTVWLMAKSTSKFQIGEKKA